MCLWADDSHIVIQIFNIEFELPEERESFHDLAVVGDCLEDLTICLFAEEDIDAVIDGLILEIIPNQRQRFRGKIVDADAMRFWFLD